jgi:hypothetical protein
MNALIALLMTSGALFGIMAMVVDIGYGMAQQGAMQTAADAGALSAARLLAVTVGNASPIIYVSSDNQVHSTATQFVAYNRLAPGFAPTYQTAVEYLRWSSSTCAPATPPVFTSASDTALVASHSGVRNSAAADTIGSVPSDTCGVRVFSQVTYDAIFAQLIGTTLERASASAAARVYPATPPTTFTRVWPITRWLGAPGCTFSINSAPCSFWDSQGPPNGSFKLVVDMSRYSALVYPSPLRQQHIVDWDHTYPGNSQNRQTDLDNWLRHGWNGQLQVGDARCANTSPSPLPFANCTNSRLEVYNGTLGNNVGDAMRAFISANAEGADTSGQNLGRYVTMNVFLWRYGESNINTSTDVASTLWTSGSSSSIQRIILEQVRCFRFYENTVSNSDARGYYVSCLSDDPPTNGGPSNVANTVALID